MSMQFTWQGCDAILAAPLVLDMARMAHLARRRGETGPMKQLACFFKDPIGVDEQDLHRQFHIFMQYINMGHTHGGDAAGAPARLPSVSEPPARPAPQPKPDPSVRPAPTRKPPR